jgi:hypothetical protein
MTSTPRFLTHKRDLALYNTMIFSLHMTFNNPSISLNTVVVPSTSQVC